MGITHKNVITKTKPDVVRIIFEIVDGGWFLPKVQYTGFCLIPEIMVHVIPGKPDVVNDTLAIYIIVHNIIIVY
jgi:hypothetical protein